MKYMLVLLFLINFCFVKNTGAKLYSNKFLLKADLNTEEVKQLAENYGFVFHKQVLHGYYVLKRGDVKDKSTIRSKWKPDTTWKDNPKIKSITQEFYTEVATNSIKPRTSRDFDVTDQYWPNMWHLHPDREPDMNVYSAWSRGYTGKGVTVAFIDSGIDMLQKDLQNNYVPELAYDYVDDDDDPGVRYAMNESSHAMECAGIAVAEKNNHCVVGISYEARYTVLRLIDIDTVAGTYSDIASAFVHQMDNISIYSNSWGQADLLYGFTEEKDVITDALRTGVYQGRGGKGVIYTFASGNGGRYGDDCNVDRYVSSIYTVAVNSIAEDGSPASYAESCTAVFISAFGGTKELGITTTDSNNMCRTSFHGTSAACPVVTGVVALVLQANPELTWRDVMHLLVETAQTTGLDAGSFLTNGAGRKVSRYYGFGLTNADAMVTRATTWKPVPQFWRLRTKIIHVNRADYYTDITSVYALGNYETNITHIEQIKVWIKFRASSTTFVEFTLTSPSGTENKLLGSRKYGSFLSTSYSFLTLHCWGEKPLGNWTLTMSGRGLYSTTSLYQWRLYIYGTTIDPVLDQSKDGIFGQHCHDGACLEHNTVCDDVAHTCVCKEGYERVNGECRRGGNTGTRCKNKQQCKQEHSVCDDLTGLCECSSGYRTFENTCIKDGTYGGSCLNTSICAEAELVCDATLGVCVKCSSDYHVLNGTCRKDGILGSHCANNSACFDDNTYCNNGTCECKEGYRVVGDICTKDGETGGKCLSNDTCTSSRAFCDTSNYTCVLCSYDSTVRDGKCVLDGSLGGFCGIFIACDEPGTVCNISKNTCYCRNGLNNETSRRCNTYGELGERCFLNTTCFDGNICDEYNKTCVSCPRYESAVNGTCTRDNHLGGHCYRYCIQDNSYCSSESVCKCEYGYRDIAGECLRFYKDGETGGKCLPNNTCTSSQAYCDKTDNTCVLCSYDSTMRGGKCVLDGSLGGYCSIYSTCNEAGTVCNMSTKTCDCPGGFNGASGRCNRYGVLGEQCFLNTTCFDKRAICNTLNNTCVLCPRKNRAVNGRCTRDGKTGEKCLPYDTCTSSRAYCDKTDNICRLCLYDSTVRDGKCVLDGSVGGFCSPYTICEEPGTRCNMLTTTCECRDGYHESSGTCNTEIGKRCLSDGTCLNLEDVCLENNNTCVWCPLWSHSIQNGSCVRDNYLGGHCYLYCIPENADCNDESICVCADGYRESSGKCILEGFKDGEPGGKCLLNGTCPYKWNVCVKENDTCVECPAENYLPIEGKCVMDGSLGGYCSEYKQCTALHTLCHGYRCACLDGFFESDGFCSPTTDSSIDGATEDRCLPNQTCDDVNSVCDTARNVCTKCPGKLRKSGNECINKEEGGRQTEFTFTEIASLIFATLVLLGFMVSCHLYSCRKQTKLVNKPVDV